MRMLRVYSGEYIAEDKIVKLKVRHPLPNGQVSIEICTVDGRSDIYNVLQVEFDSYLSKTKTVHLIPKPQKRIEVAVDAKAEA